MTTWKVSGWAISLSVGAVSIVVTATRTTGVATSLVIILPVTGSTVAAAAITATAVAATITTAAIAAAITATTTVAATATVAASSAPTVAAATTASSITAIARFLLSVVHPDLPTVDGLAVQCVHRTVGIFWVLEGDEAEAAGRHGALIFDDSSIDNLAILREHRLQGLLVCIEA